jgi:D-alanine--poly(phosphoribitol) ligase subunit 1
MHRSTPFTSRFLESCRTYPKHTAIWKDGQSHTYSELLSMVKAQIGLIRRECLHEKCIAVADQNDAYTYASFIALNLLGKTYLPLSLRNPQTHRDNILAESGTLSILSSGELQSSCAKVISSLVEPLSGEWEESLEKKESSEPAYILFTSGSTGKPKGVPVGNAQLHAFFDFFSDEPRFSFGPADRFLQVYEATFDVSVFSAFMPLFKGGCMYLLPRKKFAWLEIPQILEKEEITVLSMVPSVLQYLQPYMPDLQFKKLRYSFFSGDKLYHSLALAWSKCLPAAEIVNCYGPTETTIVCTWYPWQAEQSALESLHGIVPLGKPFPGMEFILRAENGEEAMPGETAELCFSGPQVIEAYLHNAFEEQFFTKEFSGVQKRFYRTGDRVKINAEGNLLFAGRMDLQVKINGYRVEPAETEAMLHELTGNKQCAVIAFVRKDGNASLCAFLEGTGNVATLLAELRKRLPPQAVPGLIHFLPEIPMTANGKIDRPELLRFATTEPASFNSSSP